MSSASQSRILLACVKYNVNKTSSSSLLSIDDLFMFFHIFGKIQKIIIFCQKIVLKSFVEFEKLEDANLAMECLNEKNFNNIGKIRLYASKNQNLSMANKFLCSKDFRGINQQEYVKKIKARYDMLKTIAKENKSDFVKKATGVEKFQEHSISKLSSPNLNKVNLLFLNLKNIKSPLCLSIEILENLTKRL